MATLKSCGCREEAVSVPPARLEDLLGRLRAGAPPLPSWTLALRPGAVFKHQHPYLRASNQNRGIRPSLHTSEPMCYLFHDPKRM